MERYIKKSIAPYVWLFVVWCFVLYLAFLSSPSGLAEKLRSGFVQYGKDAMLGALMPIITLVVMGLISSNNKFRLVFWRIRDPLPGTRAFSHFAVSDPRIDMAVLKAKLTPIPQTPQEQNAAWFRLYKRYSEALTVAPAHQSFLLARELCAISFLFAVLAPWGLWLGGASWKTALAYLVVMLAHYVAFAIVAQNHGNRFVCNVLVEWVADNKPGPAEGTPVAQPDPKPDPVVQ